MRTRIIPRRKVERIERDILSLFKQHKGGLIENFENRFADYIGCKYAIAVPSARIGMKLILKSYGFKRGDEVIIPAYTLGALADIIESLGLKCIPADIDRDSFNVKAENIAARISSGTKVIILAHMFGNPCRSEEIIGIAKKRGILIIEDCAHSLASEYKGKRAGSFGDAAFFSFDTIKTVNTYGGGMVVTDDKILAESIKNNLSEYFFRKTVPYKKIIYAFLEDKFYKTLLFYPVLYLLASQFGNKKIYDFYRHIQKVACSNSGYTGYQAYIGLEKLADLNKKLIKIKRLAELLKSNLKEDIAIQAVDREAVLNHYFFVLIGRIKAQEARLKLLKYGIDCGIKSEIADDCAQILGYKDCPNSRRLYEYGIQIPFYESLTKSDILYLSKVLNKVL